MSLIISNLTIGSNAPPGSVVGVLSAHNESGQSISCNFSLTKGSIGCFAITGDQLVTAWNGSTVPGYYSVRILAIGTNARFSAKATFAIQVAPPSPVPAPPPSPSPGVSPDGSVLPGGVGGSLRTVAGTWTFAPTQNSDGN